MIDVSMKKRIHNYTIPVDKIRHLNIDDLERIERLKRAGYGGKIIPTVCGSWEYVIRFCLSVLKLLGRACSW